MGTHDPRQTYKYEESTVTVAALLGRQPAPDGTPERGSVGTPTAGLSLGAAPASGGRNRRLLLASAEGLAAVAVVTALVVVHASVSARSSTDRAVTGPPRLLLTTSQVHIGGSYFATVDGFARGEGVRFSWTGPTDGVMGVYAADSNGHSGVRGPIVEQDPPGNYQIIATGLTSRRTVAKPLRVLAAER
ncbi:MAG TPA: hypothetical protein VGM60_02235 [Pseudonocardia sp.]|jgi:hypothetical protein|uniref:hypothetical protein n=1 Tax=Pseudonocardia sp. TaxID=60912 RepID=UPI002F421A04